MRSTKEKRLGGKEEGAVIHVAAHTNKPLNWGHQAQEEVINCNENEWRNGATLSDPTRDYDRGPESMGEGKVCRARLKDVGNVSE